MNQTAFKKKALEDLQDELFFDWDNTALFSINRICSARARCYESHHGKILKDELAQKSNP